MTRRLDSPQVTSLLSNVANGIGPWARSIYSRIPLFRTRLIIFEVPAISNVDRIHLDLPLCFSHLLSLFRTRLFEFPAISNSSFFPYTLNQPRYFELVKSRVQEETLKRPTKSEVRQAIETLSRTRRANKPVVIHNGRI